MPILNVNKIKSKNYLPEISGRFFRSKNNTFSFTQYKEGAVSPNHKHEFEQVVIILKGKMEFILGSEKKILGEEGVMIVPSNTCHQCIATTECMILEIFQPLS